MRFEFLVLKRRKIVSGFSTSGDQAIIQPIFLSVLRSAGTVKSSSRDYFKPFPSDVNARVMLKPITLSCS